MRTKMHRGVSGGAMGLAIAAVVVTAGPAFSQTPPAPTFARDVAPILQEKCEACHRAGEMAPMPLVTYNDVRPWARSIRTRVVARSMPPWHMDKTVGIQKFKNDGSLTDEQIDTIVRWIDAGAPLGDPRDMPAPKQWPSGETWRLEERLNRPPDLIIMSPPWTQPAEGQDQWFQAEVESGLTEDRWIQGVETKPSPQGRKVVHHVNGALAEYAPGKLGELYPDNTGELMRAGQTLTFDIHYHSYGEEVTDQVSVAVWFYPKGYVPKYQVEGMGGRATRDSMGALDIPPGVVTMHHSYIPLTENTLILSYQPHMHIRGKAMAMEAIYPDGRVELLSHVDRFDNNWHINYWYADDVAPLLPRGTVIHLTAWHDNTAANPVNPDPEQWVGWGQRTTDDMYHNHSQVIHLSDEDYQRMVEERRAARARASDQP